MSLSLFDKNRDELLKRSSGWYKAQSAATYNWIGVLRTFSKQIDKPKEYYKVDYLIEAYNALGEVLKLRTLLYEESQWRIRTEIFFKILLQGGYAENHNASLGRHALLKDILIISPFITIMPYTCHDQKTE